MQFLFPDDRSTQQTNVKSNQREIKEKTSYSYPFQERCILQQKLKSEKKRQRIPISGWRIHRNQASVGPHASLPPGGGRKPQRVQRRV